MAWTCPVGHAFDIARAGYLNLLQPQDRRSPHAGDPVASIEARSRLLAVGVGTSLLDRIVSLIAALPVAETPTAVELGCGGGELLGRVSQARVGCAVGIDLASAATARAARAWPSLTWVVANADRRLPLLDARVDLVVSVHARRNPAECARVLTRGGWLLVAVPAPEDLVELREAVFGARVERQRATTVIREHEPYFSVENQVRHSERPTLDVSQLSDLLTGTYRGARAASRLPRAALAAMAVTLASDILLFRVR